MSGASKRKPSASELPDSSSAAQTLQAYKDLMIQCGSLNGAWNPEPDEWILAMNRSDVSLSENEVKAIFGVKAHTVRYNPVTGRTAWERTQSGEPFRTTELAAFFGWDIANTRKWLKAPLAYGFVRKNDTTGELGIGALVSGKVAPEPPDQPSEVDLLVRTDKLPLYLAEALVATKSKDQQELFLKNVWRPIKAKFQQRLNDEKKRIYDEEQKELTLQCKAFDPNLPELKRKNREEETAEKASDLSVRTSNEASCTKSESPLYNADSDSVRTTYIRNQSKAVNSEESSSSVRAALREYSRTPVDDNAAQTLLTNCQAKASDATAEDVVRIIHQKGAILRTRQSPRGFGVNNPVGFLLTAVANAFTGGGWREAARAAAKPTPEAAPSPEQQIEDLLRLKAQYEADPGHPALPNLNRQLTDLHEQLNGRFMAGKPAEGEPPRVQAQEAGRG